MCTKYLASRICAHECVMLSQARSNVRRTSVADAGYFEDGTISVEAYLKPMGARIGMVVRNPRNGVADKALEVFVGGRPVFRPACRGAVNTS